MQLYHIVPLQSTGFRLTPPPCLTSVALATDVRDPTSQVLVSSSALEMKAAAGHFDLIMNTIPIEHDFYAYKPLLKPRGKMVMLGLNTGLIAGFAVDAIVCGASKIKGSGIGGIEATQAVIDLCAKHDIKPEIKVSSVHRKRVPLEPFVCQIGMTDLAASALTRHAPSRDPPSAPL